MAGKNDARRLTTLADFIRRYPEYAEEVMERAAIMEYDGGFSREDAEEEATLRVFGRPGGAFDNRKKPLSVRTG